MIENHSYGLYFSSCSLKSQRLHWNRLKQWTSLGILRQENLTTVTEQYYPVLHSVLESGEAYQYECSLEISILEIVSSLIIIMYFIVWFIPINHLTLRFELLHVHEGGPVQTAWKLWRTFCCRRYLPNSEHSTALCFKNHPKQKHILDSHFVNHPGLLRPIQFSLFRLDFLQYSPKT